MSMWMTVKTEVQDLDVFKRICEECDLDFIERDNPKFGYERTRNGQDVFAAVVDRTATSRNYGLLLEAGKGAYQLAYDSDPHYCTLSKRFGKNGGTLMRDYAAGALKKQMLRRGASQIGKTQTKQDGSLVLRFAVNG